MKKNKMVVILSDAFRHDYIEKHQLQHLQKMLQENNRAYIKKVIPNTGFCEIVEYVTGQPTTSHRLLTQITARPDWHKQKSPFSLRIVDLCCKVLNKIPKIRNHYNKHLGPILRLTKTPDEMIPLRYNIPLHLLNRFTITEAKHQYDDDSFGGPENNLFSWLRANSYSYDISDFVFNNKVTGTDDQRLERLQQKIQNKKLEDFTLLYIGYCELAHFFGPSSKKFANTLSKYSEKLETIHNEMKKNYPDATFVVLGDHGMLPVENYINIKPKIRAIMRKYKLKQGKDYLCFIDSTMLRIWLNNKELTQNIKQEFESLLTNELEQDETIKEYFAQFTPDFGDMILPLRKGYVFYPDYFNMKPNKGMHGYANHYTEQHGIMFALGNTIPNTTLDSMHLHEVKDYLISLLDN